MLRNRQATDGARQARIALWLYSFLVPVVTILSWVTYIHRAAYETPFDSRPLFALNDQFRDLTNYFAKTAHLYRGATALGGGVPYYTYPAPAAFVYKALLYTCPSHPVRTFLVFLAIGAVGFAMVARRSLGPNLVVRLAAVTAITMTVFLGYPLWFTIDRGNIEGVVWVFAAAGLCLLLRRRFAGAAVLIGIAVAIKPFSMLFLLLLIVRRKYREATLALHRGSLEPDCADDTCPDALAGVPGS